MATTENVATKNSSSDMTLPVCHVTDRSRGDETAAIPLDTLVPASTSHSYTSSTGPVCRICYDGRSKEDLISPCKCSGTMGLLHRSCIERWLGSRNSNQCEICHFEYVTIRKPKSFCEWLRNPARPSDLRNLIGDLLCFLLLTPLASASCWLCITGAITYADMNSAEWEALGLAALSVFLVLIYLVWCTVAFRYNVRVFTEWQKSNQIVQVIGLKETAKKYSSTSFISNALRSNRSSSRARVHRGVASTGIPLAGTTTSDTVVDNIGGARDTAIARIMTFHQETQTSPQMMPWHTSASTSLQANPCHATVSAATCNPPRVIKESSCNLDWLVGKTFPGLNRIHPLVLKHLDSETTTEAEDSSDEESWRITVSKISKPSGESVLGYQSIGGKWNSAGEQIPEVERTPAAGDDQIRHGADRHIGDDLIKGNEEQNRVTEYILNYVFNSGEQKIVENELHKSETDQIQFINEQIVESISKNRVTVSGGLTGQEGMKPATVDGSVATEISQKMANISGEEGKLWNCTIEKEHSEVVDALQVFTDWVIPVDSLDKMTEEVDGFVAISNN